MQKETIIKYLKVLVKHKHISEFKIYRGLNNSVNFLSSGYTENLNL